MIKKDLNHKEANLTKIIKTLKKTLVIGAMSIPVFLYSGCKEYEISVNSEITGHSDEHKGWDILTGKAEKEVQEDLNKAYHSYIERKESEEPAKEKIDLMYDETLDDSTIIEIKDKYNKQMILHALYGDNYDENATITIEDLKQLKELYLMNEISVERDKDISWLNYCQSLEKLELEIVSEEAVEALNQIEGLKNLKTFSINGGPFLEFSNIPINEQYFSFLKQCPNLRNLIVDASSFSINDELLKEIGSKEYGYSIKLDGFNVWSDNIEPDKLNNCTDLTIYPALGDGTYDIATVMSREQFNKLISSNIEVELRKKDYNSTRIPKETMIEKVNRIYDEIDKIVEKINIDEKMSEEEKVEEILKYVLENVTYYEKSKELQGEVGTETNIFGQGNKELETLTIEKSYKDGYLYGALAHQVEENEELEPAAICGVYAALVNVCCDRYGIESNVVIGNNHAWNLVNIDGEYWYVDPTALDNEEIDINKMIKDNSYLINPNFTTYHEPTNKPYNIDFSANEENEKETAKIAENAIKEYKVKLNGQVVMVSAGTLMSILSGLGIAISKRQLESIRKNRKSEEREKAIQAVTELIKRKEAIKKQEKIIIDPRVLAEVDYGALICENEINNAKIIMERILTQEKEEKENEELQ